MTFTDWLSEQAAMRTDEVADFAQGVACHALWPVNGRKLETFEDFVVREFGPGAVKVLHRAWNEFQKTKAPKPQESPFGGAMARSMARKSRQRPKKTSESPEEPVTAGYQHGNFWQGHPTLDKSRLPMKPPGR